VKPYISELLELRGKRYLLPLPSKRRELLDALKMLGIKSEEDDHKTKLVGYVTNGLPAPSKETGFRLVAMTAARTSELTDKQVKALGVLCQEFKLAFEDILWLLNSIKGRKEQCE
jgi:hypothetical protein